MTYFKRCGSPQCTNSGRRSPLMRSSNMSATAQKSMFGELSLWIALFAPFSLLRNTWQIDCLPSRVRAVCFFFKIEIVKSIIRGATASLCQYCWRNLSNVGLEEAGPPRFRPCTFIYGDLWNKIYRVYIQRIQNIKYLRPWIQETVSSITLDGLDRVWGELEYHLDFCRAHIELWWTRKKLNDLFYHFIHISCIYLLFYQFILL